MHLGSQMLPEHSFPVRRKSSVGFREDRRGLLSPSSGCAERLIKEAALQSTEPRWGWGMEDLLKVRALSASSEEQGQRAIRALKALNDARLKGGPFQDQASALHEALRPMAFGQAFEHGLLSRLCPAAEFMKVSQDTSLELYGQCDALYVVLSGSAKVTRGPVLVSRMLSILVKSATGLLGDSEQDRLDPYVKVQVGNHVQQTPAMNDAGADPEWNYTIRLPYNNEPRIEFNVMEEDDYSRDDLLGTAYLDAFMFVRDGWEGELTLGLGLPDRSRAAAAPPQGSQIGRNVRAGDGPKASDGAGRLSVKLSFDLDPAGDGRISHAGSRKASGEESPSGKTRLASTAPLSSAIFSAAAAGISPPGTPLAGSRANTDSPGGSPSRGRAKSVMLPNASIPNHSTSGLGLDSTLERAMSMVPSGSRQSGKTETTKRFDFEMTGDSTQFATTAPLKSSPDEDDPHSSTRILLPGHFFGYDAGGGALETLQTTEFAVFPRSILNIASEAFLKEKKEEKSNFLKEFFPGLKEIDPTAFDNFVGAFQYETLPAGHTLVQAGECPGKNSSRVLLLKRGTCQEFIPNVRSTVISKPLNKMKDIYKPPPPTTLSVGVLGPGAVVGFASALFGLVEPFTVIAQDTVTVLELHSSLRVPWPKAVVPRLAELLKSRTDFHLERWRHLRTIPTSIPLEETPYKPHQWKVSDAPFWRNKSLNSWRANCITDLYDAVGWTPPAASGTSSSSAAVPSLLPTGGASSSPASSPANSRPSTSPMALQGGHPHQSHIQAPPPLPLSPLAKRSNSRPSSPFGLHAPNSPATFTGGNFTPPGTALSGTTTGGFAGSFGGTFGVMVGDKSSGLATASTTAGSFCPRTATPPTPPCKARPLGGRIPECRSEPQLSRPGSSSSSATALGARGSTPPSAALTNSTSALAKRKGQNENVYNVNSGLGRCNTPWGVWSPSGLLDPPSQKLRPSGVVLQKVRERRKRLSQSRPLGSSSVRPASRGLASSAGADAEVVERTKQDHPPVNFHVAKDWQRMRQVASSQALEKMYRRQARASSIAKSIS